MLAPHTYSGTMKASLFEKWFEDKLLNCLPKGHVIIKINAAFHKKEVLQNLARKYSQKLIFLPLYSPEYNPIEHTHGTQFLQKLVLSLNGQWHF